VGNILKKLTFFILSGFLLLLVSQPRLSFAQGKQLCSSLNRRWRDWCVYTNNKEKPKGLLNNIDNLYHPSVWRQDGRVYLVAGGWRDKVKQGGHDRIFLFHSDDYLYGREGWQIAAFPFIGNNWDSPSAQHSVQPSVFAGPFPLFPGGPDCCLTIYYTWDVQGGFPENNTTIHWAFMAPNGSLSKVTKNNPILTKESGSIPEKEITAVHNGHIFYDSQTRKFYLYYNEWLDNNYLAVSVAESDWLDRPFIPIAHDALSGQYSSPMMVKGGDSRYYLFFTHWLGVGGSQIEMVAGDEPDGHFDLANKRVVLDIPESLSSDLAGADTAFVLCNRQLDRWQMYFSASSADEQGSHLNNQVYTAFLESQSCDSPPYLIYDVNDDGLVNQADISNLLKKYATSSYDLTGDARTNGIDFVKLASFVYFEGN